MLRKKFERTSEIQKCKKHQLRAAPLTLKKITTDNRTESPQPYNPLYVDIQIIKKKKKRTSARTVRVQQPTNCFSTEKVGK